MAALMVNGEQVDYSDEPDMPLLWFLRDTLGLKGTKYCCETGLCGVWTVHMNGNPILSCITPMSSTIDKNITTIEGLALNSEHPVLQAWLEERVPQCGYCQPAQIMTASALLALNSNPSDVHIDEVMSQVLCRCGTYQRIRKAVHRAAILMQKESNLG